MNELEIVCFVIFLQAINLMLIQLHVGNIQIKKFAIIVSFTVFFFSGDRNNKSLRTVGEADNLFRVLDFYIDHYLTLRRYLINPAIL